MESWSESGVWCQSGNGDERRGMANGVVRIMCPNLRCRAVLAVPPEARGRLVRCRNCGMSIKIPAKGAGGPKAAPAPDAASTEEPKKKAS